MNPAFVLDCSVTMSWCFREETSAASARIQDRLAAEAALVPAHWYLEVANVLSLAERRQRITRATTEAFVGLLSSLGIEAAEDPLARAFDHLIPLCRAHRLSSYDAAYLDLAQRRHLPLATLDDSLRAAAKSLGITLLGC